MSIGDRIEVPPWQIAEVRGWETLSLLDRARQHSNNSLRGQVLTVLHDSGGCLITCA